MNQRDSSGKRAFDAEGNVAVFHHASHAESSMAAPASTMATKVPIAAASTIWAASSTANIMVLTMFGLLVDACISFLKRADARLAKWQSKEEKCGKNDRGAWGIVAAWPAAS